MRHIACVISYDDGDSSPPPLTLSDGAYAMAYNQKKGGGRRGLLVGVMGGFIGRLYAMAYWI